MIEVKLLYRIVMAVALCLLYSKCKASVQKGTNADTVILAENVKPFSIDGSQPFYQVSVKAVEKKLYDNTKKIFLLLDDPHVTQNPDGVYEAYISMQKSDIKTLTPDKPDFVNVLDLYSLTSSQGKKHLSIDISKNMVQFVKAGNQFPPVVITILFRGNSLPGNSESENAGQITVKGVRIIQEK